jgi:SAM-dependent methyltransferase
MVEGECPGNAPIHHAVDWTPERIERFWNFYSSNVTAHDSYFSRQFGRAIIRLARRHGRLASPVVDFGCGPGYLLEELLRAGFPCKAIDVSAQAVRRVQERFAGRPGFLGAAVGRLDRLPLQSGEAGAIFLIEVLEHLSPQDAATMCAEFRRVLQPGGRLIVTVPNEEDLQAGSVACPDCGCVFHRMQHIQSFSSESVSEWLRGAGFEPILVRSFHFKHFAGNWLTRPWGLIRHGVRHLRRRLNPHLLAIGRRPPT